MELQEALKYILEEYGRNALRSGRLLNFLADSKISYEYPSMKFILKIMIEEGIVMRLLDADITKLEVDSCLLDLTEKYGFRREVSCIIVNSILSAVGKNDCVVNVDTETKTLNIPQASNDSHIVFSGISLGESVTDIAKYLTTRGFRKTETKPYDIIMKGEFCGISDVKLSICGSPFNLTQSILLNLGGPTVMYPHYVNNLYDLLKRKYGEPYDFYDKFKIIGRNIQYYCEKILQFSEAEENFVTIIEIEWIVDGGTIKLDWTGNVMTLKYIDTVNSEFIENHKDDFNISSI